jgi:hypothetical protein
VPQSAAGEATRLLVVTPGNIRQSHLYVRGLYDFFPRDCIGPSRKSKTRNAHEIEIHLDGLDKVVRTDIGVTPSTGKPRFFRGRAWVRRFFQHHELAGRGPSAGWMRPSQQSDLSASDAPGPPCTTWI